jgi:hypothetical protein
MVAHSSRAERRSTFRYDDILAADIQEAGTIWQRLPVVSGGFKTLFPTGSALMALRLSHPSGSAVSILFNL